MNKVTNETNKPSSSIQQPNAGRRTDFMTVGDWAAKIQVSKRTVFRMIDEGAIPAYDLSIGKVRRWHVETYEKWVADQK